MASAPLSGPPGWWREAVVYQVYPRSFADADGDGLGDLRGVIDHLNALVELGVDALWLSPFYPSPQVDGGYDVSDHRDVDHRFGDLATFEQLVDAAHRRGLRVIIDLVPNHTSDHHPWFREALAAPPGDPSRSRYLFRAGRGDAGELPPNDWQSVFGGPAWTRVLGPGTDDDEWYLHLFAPQQPDLDWTWPEVRAEFESILGFWMDRGVDGFRIDVAHGLAKDPAMPNLSGCFPTAGLAPIGHPHWDRDEVHDVYRSWRRVLDGRPGERVFVAEAYLADPARLARYVRHDELHTAFNFRFLMARWNATELRSAIEDTLATHDGVGAPATWVLSNHDVVRVATRYGDGAVGRERARAAALLMFALPGSAYVYQGEELGLPEVEDLPGWARQDPTFERTGGAERGRDGCRVPLPWTAGRPAYGFSPTGATWLPQPGDWDPLSRDRQRNDPTSMLLLYRAAIGAREQLRDAHRSPELVWVDLGPDALAFDREGGVRCVTNLSDSPLEVPGAAEPLLLSHPLLDGSLGPDSSGWFWIAG